MRWLWVLAASAAVLAACERGAAPVASAPAPPATLPFTLSKATTAIVSPLLPDGRPDYIAAANDAWRRGKPPAENGFVVYLRVVGTDVIPEAHRAQMLSMCGAPAGPALEPAWQSFFDFANTRRREAGAQLTNDEENEQDVSLGEVWTASRHPLAAAYLERYAGHLDGFREMGERPVFWVPVIPDSSGMLASYLHTQPPIGGVDDAAIAFCSRATLRAGTGDAEGFLNDIVAAKNIARELGGSPFVVDRLRAYRLDNAADRAIGAAVGAGKIPGGVCARLREFCGILGPYPGPSIAADRTMRWSLLESAELMAIGRFDALKAIAAPLAWREIDRSKVDWDALLRGINSDFDAAMTDARESDLPTLWKKKQAGMNAAMELLGPMIGAAIAGTQPAPMATPTLQAVDDETREHYTHRVQANLLQLDNETQTAAAMELLWRENRLRDQMATALLAIAELRQRLGHWPATIDELPRASRDLLVDDPYAPRGVKVRYHVTGNSARVYSVGPDGVDSGGENDRRLPADDLAVGG